MSRPITGEPTHTTDSGATSPGSQPLTSTVTPQLISDANVTWSDHLLANNADQLNNYSAQNPTIAAPYSPVETLINDALERFGNMSVDSIDSNIRRIMLKYANRIVEDVRRHPYTSTPDLDYYVSLQDTRPIPDEIMISGLAYYYAKWQNSLKSKDLFGDYTVSLNSILYQRKYGSGKIQMNTVDKDTAGIE